VPPVKSCPVNVAASAGCEDARAIAPTAKSIDIVLFIKRF
jgi:hypothetical protein